MTAAAALFEPAHEAGENEFLPRSTNLRLGAQSG